MADPETQQQAQAQPHRAGTIALNMSYVKSPRGIIKIVEIFLLMIAFACMADLCPCKGRGSFFLFSTIFPWIICIVIFILYLFCLVEQIPQLNWPFTVMVNAIIWAIAIVISSSLIADLIQPKAYYYSREKVYNNFCAAVAFGFLSVIAFIIDAFLHFQLVRS